MWLAELLSFAYFAVPFANLPQKTSAS